MARWNKATYEMVAKVLRTTFERDTTIAYTVVDPTGNHTTLTLRFAQQFETDNPRFDRERFLKACGVKE